MNRADFWETHMSPMKHPGRYAILRGGNHPDGGELRSSLPIGESSKILPAFDGELVAALRLALHSQRR